MAEQTRIYVWRSRARGFLVVTAKSLDEAYEVITEKHANWLNYAQAHEPHDMPARAGELMYLNQRG